MDRATEPLDLRATPGGRVALVVLDAPEGAERVWEAPRLGAEVRGVEVVGAVEESDASASVELFTSPDGRTWTARGGAAALAPGRFASELVTLGADPPDHLRVRLRGACGLTVLARLRGPTPENFPREPEPPADTLGAGPPFVVEA